MSVSQINKIVDSNSSIETRKKMIRFGLRIPAKKEDAMLPWQRNSEFTGKLNLKQPKNWPIPIGKRTSPIYRTRNSFLTKYTLS